MHAYQHGSIQACLRLRPPLGPRTAIEFIQVINVQFRAVSCVLWVLRALQVLRLESRLVIGLDATLLHIVVLPHLVLISPPSSISVSLGFPSSLLATWCQHINIRHISEVDPIAVIHRYLATTGVGH